MPAFTFEANIVSEYLLIPHFEELKNKHVRVVIEPDEMQISDIDHCFDRFHYDLNSQPFNRDEANAR
jgi:hypothetical protein